MVFKVPGVSVDRENFLRKELNHKYLQGIIEQAILSTPMKVSIRQDDIDKIATAAGVESGKNVGFAGGTGDLGAGNNNNLT